MTAGFRWNRPAPHPPGSCPTGDMPTPSMRLQAFSCAVLKAGQSSPPGRAATREAYGEGWRPGAYASRVVGAVERGVRWAGGGVPVVLVDHPQADAVVVAAGAAGQDSVGEQRSVVGAVPSAVKSHDLGRDVSAPGLAVHVRLLRAAELGSETNGRRTFSVSAAVIRGLTPVACRNHLPSDSRVPVVRSASLVSRPRRADQARASSSGASSSARRAAARVSGALPSSSRTVHCREVRDR